MTSTAPHRMTRLAPGYYTAQIDGREVTVQRVRMDDGPYWVLLVDGVGGDDLYYTKWEAVEAIDAYLTN